MTKYIYHVSVNGNECDCQTVQQAVHFANSVIGCDLVSNNMVFTYFSKCRPDKVNKQILGQLIQLSRTEVATRSSNSLA